MRKILLLSALAGLLTSTAVSAEPATRVFLNGVPAPVYFNDGDSFRVLGGEYAGTKARLSGFNTLESYGPVHQWGGWHAKELYFLAKLATTNAQRGVWNCETEGETDTYNRILWYCKDLAVDQVKRGLAHAMTVTDEPAKPELVEAQLDAIKNRRGIWSHGVPEFVLTSLHSASEGGGSDGRTYNRMVSSKDGHSEKWLHKDNYGECDKICHVDHSLPAEALDRFVAVIKADSVAATHLEGLDDAEIKKRAARFISKGSVGYMTTKEAALALDDQLPKLVEPFTPEMVEGNNNGCMVYVDFRRRYGGDKAKCLK